MCIRDSTLHAHADIADALKDIGVAFEQWQPAHPVIPGDPAEAIMAAYQLSLIHI